MNERFCLDQSHNNSQILAYCITECCRRPTRALCFKCMTGQGHQGHDLIEPQSQQENRFYQDSNRVFSEIKQKLSLMKRQFDFGLKLLESILEKNYMPVNLNTIGNQVITNKINCMLKLEKVSKLINDRVDNIFENTLKQVKITIQDLTLGKELECYEVLQKQNYPAASLQIDECLQQDSKNILLKLAKADIFQVNNRQIDARNLYEEMLNQNDANPWAQFELKKLMNSLERR